MSAAALPRASMSRTSSIEPGSAEQTRAPRPTRVTSIRDTSATPGGVSGGPLALDLAKAIGSRLPRLELEDDGRLAELAARTAVVTQAEQRAPTLAELDSFARDVGLVGPVPFVAVLPYVGGVFQRLREYIGGCSEKQRVPRTGCS